MRRIVAECARQLQANLAGMIAGGDAPSDDTEHVHQARVALRRLRSADTAFAELPAERAWQNLVAEAQWLAGLLGALRDLQVLGGETLPPIAQANAGAVDFAPLQAELARRSARAHAQLLRALQSKRYRALMTQLQRWLDAEPATVRTDLTAFARRSLTRRWRRVDTLAARWDRLDANERHTLRKRVKKLRYAIEFFAALYPAKSVAKYVQRLQSMQAALGNLNDAVAAQALLRPSLRHRQTAPAASALLGWLNCSEQNQLGGAAALIARWRRCDPFWR